MVLLTQIRLKIGFGPADDGWLPHHTRRIVRAAALSIALHVLVILALIFLVPRLMPPPIEELETIPVDLINLGDVTTPPVGLKKAGQPQQATEEAAKPVTDMAGPTSQFEEPSAKTTPLTKPLPDKKSPIAEDINNLLALVEKSHRSIKPETNAPTNQPQRLTNGATTGLDLSLGEQGTFRKTVPGPTGTLNVKDFIRAQIERRWEFDVQGADNDNVIISIHIVLARDGTIERADVVDQSRYVSDALFHQIADSARRAVLLSSPLQIPTGQYETVRDTTLDFSLRDVLR